MSHNKLMDHNELMAREPNVEGLQRAYDNLSKDPPKGIAELEALARGGSVLSMLYLGDIYSKKRTPPDTLKAEHWYNLAYLEGSIDAVYYLGSLYYRRSDYEKAKEIFNYGVDYDDPVSMYWLASVYVVDQRRHGQKAKEIRGLLERSSAMGQIYAKNSLGRMLVRGQYGARNIPRGVFLVLSSLAHAFKVGIRNPDDRRLW